MNSSDVNKELLIGFIDESIDSLNIVDSLFINLENHPGDMEIVNAIFRPIHSLKGTAAYFGLMRLKKLAHSLENLLDLIRKGTLQVDSSVINVLLPGVDSLRAMLVNVRNDCPEISDEKVFQATITNIENRLGKALNIPDIISINQIEQNLTQLHTLVTGDGLDALDRLILSLSSIPALKNLKIHSLKVTNSSVPQCDTLNAVTKLSNLLNETGAVGKNSEIINQVSNYISQMRDENPEGNSAKIVSEIADIFDTFTHADTGLDSLAVSMILEKLSEVKTDKEMDVQSTKCKNDNESSSPKEKTDVKNKHDKTMRIPEQSLDDFLRCVGELLGIEEVLRNLTRQLNSSIDTNTLSSSLKDVVGHFESISKELRNKIMEVRKVEARILLQKSPRIVRDISVQSGKKIDVECIGDDIRIDKSYIDLLDAPLTHMVRNAADHGIETPAVRSASGKPETGKITIKLLENADDLQLIIQDDGAGLNYDALQRKAISLGIIDNNAPISKNEIIDLIFTSGVSTAAVVTDISGRGVGMDIVKHAIVDAGGKIEISSNSGIGTTFTVSIPRNASTQIIDGYIVRSFSDELYVFPLANVVEAFCILPEEICGMVGKGKVLNRRGTIFPLHKLDDLLGSGTNASKYGSELNEMGVLVEMRGKKIVIAVKEIDGIQKVVCKQIEGRLLDKELFDGAAISGTGHVSMIVNMEKLLGSQ